MAAGAMRGAPAAGGQSAGYMESRRRLWSVVGPFLLLGFVMASAPAKAQEDTSRPPRPVVRLPRLVVRAGVQAAPLDSAAISTIDVKPAEAGRPGIDLSEQLTGVPGILARDRQDRAQDEQISIRGFGARASFGVRGIDIYVDGIPASMPDGQGQVSHINLDSAGRIVVMRGPFFPLYGSAPGGVVQVWSASGTRKPETVLGVDAGGNDLFRYSMDSRGTAGQVDYNVAAAHLLEGGYRRHSRARRDSANAKFDANLGDGQRLSVVLNTLAQPVAQDPQGLTHSEWLADPREASPASQQYDTRKSTRQSQLGLIYERPLAGHDRLRAMAYGGQRDVLQFQSIPVAAQRNPLQPGGVVGLDAGYAGADLRWTREGPRYHLAVGASVDSESQQRRGYENYFGDVLGVQGALRRNEHDSVRKFAGYAQWQWNFTPHWAFLLGMRHEEVRFHTRDLYVTPLKPDDSGGARYRATTPVARLQFKPGERMTLYARYGNGFETPSWNELGYRTDGRPGLAFDLRPATSRHLELGAEWRSRTGLALEATLFRADTRNELAVASSSNGRATYRNLGNTRRQGVELSLAGELAPQWQILAAYTRLQARFESAFLACGERDCVRPDVPVPAGTRIPGAPASDGSLQLSHGNNHAGWREDLTVAGFGATSANDEGSAHAPGGLRVDLDASHALALGANRRLLLSVRLDNVFDRRLIGAVVVNDAGDRYFEPAPGRTLVLGARMQF